MVGLWIFFRTSLEDNCGVTEMSQEVVSSLIKLHVSNVWSSMIMFLFLNLTEQISVHYLAKVVGLKSILYFKCLCLYQGTSVNGFYSFRM